MRIKMPAVRIAQGEKLIFNFDLRFFFHYVWRFAINYEEQKPNSTQFNSTHYIIITCICRHRVRLTACKFTQNRSNTFFTVWFECVLLFLLCVFVPLLTEAFFHLSFFFHFTHSKPLKFVRDRLNFLSCHFVSFFCCVVICITEQGAMRTCATNPFFPVVFG